MLRNQNEATSEEYLYFDSIIPELLEKSTIRIPTLYREARIKNLKSNGDGQSLAHYTSELYEASPPPMFKEVFPKGISSCWLMNKEYFHKTTIKFDERQIAPYILALDIFTDYLLLRKVIPYPEKFLSFWTENRINQGYEILEDETYVPEALVFAYQYPSARGFKWQFDKGQEDDWMQALADEISKLGQVKDIDKATKTMRWNSYLIIPMFTRYLDIHINNLPTDAYPNVLSSLGTYVVLPVTFRDLHRWYEKIQKNPGLLHEDNNIHLSDIHKGNNPTGSVLNIRIEALAKYVFHQRLTEDGSSLDQIRLWYKKAVVSFFNTLNKSARKTLTHVEKGESTWNDLINEIFKDEDFNDKDDDLQLMRDRTQPI